MKKLAFALTELMFKYNVTQKELSEATGINRSSISGYVNGKKNPSQTTIKKISAYFGAISGGVDSNTINTQEHSVTEIKRRNFAETLNGLIESKHITQGAFADAIGVSRQTANYYLRGASLPKPEVLDKICEYFNVPRSTFNFNAETIELPRITLLVKELPSSPKECIFAKFSISSDSLYRCTAGDCNCLFSSADRKCPFLAKGVVADTIVAD